MNAYSLLSLIAAAVCFFFTTLVLIKGKNSRQSRSFCLATILTGIWTLFPFLTSLAPDNRSALLIGRSLYIVAAFVPTAWFYFMINISSSTGAAKRLVVFFFTSLFFSAVSLTPFLIEGVTRFAPHFSPQPGPLFPLFMVFFAVVFVEILYRLLIAIKNARGYRRSQLIYVNWAYLLGAISGIIHFAAAYFQKEPLPHDIFIIVYPFILTYAILRYRLMDIRVAITRTGVFLVVYTLVLGVPFLLATLGQGWLRELLGERWLIGPMALIAALATGGPFLYIFLQRRAEAILLREQKHYHETLRRTAAGMVRIHNIQVWLDLIADVFFDTVRVSHCAIYLFDEPSEGFSLQRACNAKEPYPQSVSKNNALIRYLKKHREPIVYDEIRQQSEEGSGQFFNKIEQQMKLLNATVIIPSFSGSDLSAIFVLGDKSSGRLYTSEDLSIFAVLASQAALALDNARLYEDIENQVRQRTRELVETQRLLVQAEKLATVGTLAGGVAHEINNPLSAILTNVQMMLSSYEDFNIAEAKESLELIEEATKRCREIVKKLMTYAKKPLETAAVSKVDVGQALGKAISFLQYQLEQENIKIIADIGKKGCYVIGNHNELEQVVTNIILNARDAIKKKGSSGNIYISLLQNDDTVQIIIRDEGAGIPENALAKIFDPFFTTKEVGKGLGLGLSICQSIIDKHKGFISVKSEPQKGAEFIIELPKHKASSVTKIN